MALPEPAGQRLVSGREPEQFLLAERGQRLIAAPGHVAGRPPVHEAKVTEQVAYQPPGAAWHRRIQAGHVGGLRQQLALITQAGNVIGHSTGDGVLAIHDTSMASGQHLVAASRPAGMPRWKNAGVLTGRRLPVTTPSHSPASDGIDLSDSDFWAQSLAKRHADFARLRSLGQPPYFTDPETPFAAPGGGYYALVRHADVAEASRHPEVFCSGRGATSIVDLPVEFNEYFGSMINMDDPRHARLRRIVSRAFTPRMIKRFEDDVQRTAAAIVDELLASGPGTSSSRWQRSSR